MRDIALTISVIGMLPVALMQPHIEALLSAWFSVDDLRARLGERARVDVSRVAEIASVNSGKYRYVVSHVAASASGA